MSIKEFWRKLNKKALASTIALFLFGILGMIFIPAIVLGVIILASLVALFYLTYQQFKIFLEK
jgi:hypothetical protein